MSKEENKKEQQELIINGYRLYTGYNQLGDEVVKISFPSGEGMNISKEKLTKFLDKIYDEEF